MPLRKYKVLGVRSAKSPDTGDLVYSVDLSLIDTVSIKFKTPAQLLNKDIYEALVGEIVSLKVREGDFNGEPWTAFAGDGTPDVQVDARSFLKNRSPNNPFSLNLPQADEGFLDGVDTSTGEVLSKKPDSKDSNLPAFKKAG